MKEGNKVQHFDCLFMIITEKISQDIKLTPYFEEVVDVVAKCDEKNQFF